MFTLLLQIWGGLFYLLNKLFFSFAERSNDIARQYKWRVFAWAVYITGLPAWVVVFIFEHNWIAAAVESSGVPAMAMGLYTALRPDNNSKKAWLDYLSKLMIIIGIGLSLYDFGGITTLNQILELGIAFGFIFGTYFLAKFNPQGYFWFFGGNFCAAYLMMIQGYYLLMAQQLLSAFILADAYFIRKKKSKLKENFG